jgi:hypothetical protein
MMRAIGQYISERVPAAVFVPAIASLTLAAVWCAGMLTAPSAWLIVAAVVALLVLQFRLWDDLEDRDRDRAGHPHRLVVRSDPAPFRAWAGTLAGLAALVALSAGGVTTFIATLALNVTALIAYRWIRPYVAPAVWRFLVLLAKYPAFVVIAASAAGDVRADRAAAAALITYLAAWIYEAVHARVATAGAPS